MTYEEVVEAIRDMYENADARMIFEHIAVQINIEGEGAGILYIEVADRQICVEPYDYYDRDGLLITTAKTVMDIARHRRTIRQAIEDGSLRVEGNLEKLRQLEKVEIH